MEPNERINERNDKKEHRTIYRIFEEKNYSNNKHRQQYFC